MPGFTPSALSAFGVAEGQTSPLVLDLDGDGVELTDHDGAIEDILFTWAGVDGIATDSRGPYIDARRLEFLKECFDAEWQQYGYLPDPEVNAAAQLEVSWDIVFTAMKAALLLQSGADELFADALTYDAWSGEIVGDLELDEDAVGDLADVAPAPGTANEAFWMAVARFIDDVQGLGELTGTEEGWLDDAVQASDATLTWEDVLDLLEASEPPVNYDDTSGNDVMTGSAGANSMRGFEGDDEISGLGGDDTLDGGDGADELYGGDGDDLIYGGAANPVQNDILDGGHGNDTLHGYRGDDTLTGGTGGNFLYGGMGDDTYIYAGGSDVLAEEGSGGTDILELPDGIELADLDLYRIQTGSSTTTFNDLLIRIDGGGSIQIGQQFRTDTGYQVETLVFHDTSTLDLLDLDIDTLLTEGDDYLAVTLSTADADDVVYGLSGDDSIRTFSGNDILDGGTGNDILQGDDGHDTYIASPG